MKINRIKYKCCYMINMNMFNVKRETKVLLKNFIKID